LKIQYLFQKITGMPRNDIMTDKQRLEKALAKIEARKKRLREEGITEPSKLGYAMRDLIVSK